MSWGQVSFVLDNAMVEPVSEVLESFLALAVTTENAGKDEFYEVAFPGTPDWQKVKLTALFDVSVDLQEIVEIVLAQCARNYDVEVPAQIGQLDDQDWQRVWLSSFKPIQVGKDLWVCPSWCQPTQPEARNIILDPGLAFGTGTHATTHMCLSWLAEQQLDGQQVLDYGSGSGILAIASLFSGAQHADAVDIDPLAVKACKENANRNGVEQRLNAYLPTDSPDRSYELVIANILAEVIIELRETLLLHLAHDGTLLLTGILTSQAEKIEQSFPELNFIHQTQDHWCLLIGSFEQPKAQQNN